MQMKDDLAKRADRARELDQKYREQPEIVVKVVCRYRAELFFKISRKTKMSRIMTAWTLRMELEREKKLDPENSVIEGILHTGKLDPNNLPPTEIQFLFMHNGRKIDPESSAEDNGMEEGDEIVAIELMDLTRGGSAEDWVSFSDTALERHSNPIVRRSMSSLSSRKLRRTGRTILKSAHSLFSPCSPSDRVPRARQSIEDIFDGVYASSVLLEQINMLTIRSLASEAV